ncbi:NAD(P)H-dependent flavin oxidoreductase [Magnetospirillum sulfuroxidans]|uniref:Nitronate monooxygenase n=1 Tax=Magnetospirillum sulfuroxidans TaxID=611300 RepID=A0ABS5IEZ4_9PROT|nr:nitronate monooxygenase [Magnetospirillum sulfuroxidans]MBR9972303.1 nitronate monooxygenase [Magnetospirillum sulfuroxidans]
MFKLDPIVISGREVLPLVEGGKGINVSNGESSGAWAAAGGVATFSGVNADNYDENGDLIPMIYHTKTRSERHGELIAFGIKGAIAQARIAHDISGGNGRLHMNVLWEMGGAEEILEGALQGAKGLIHGVTCGAGMPYRVAEIAAKYGVYYYPIVSSARAFRALWKRAYNKYGQLLGGVVYEDPWLAGGHNGLSNSENPEKPEPPYARVRDLRATMRECGVADAVPIFMAGGVWALKEWSDWIGNPELGAIAFQFGTRPLLTQESPISAAWKHRLLTLEPGDVLLHRFSPTGFYSSAVKNDFIIELVDRSHRQIAFSSEAMGDHVAELPIGARKRIVWVTPHDKEQALAWVAAGFTEALRTPENTLVFVDAEKAEEIRKDQVDCMGCLSQCAFSNWAQNEAGTTGKKADPRSFCIQKTLQNIGHGGDVENELMFAGHNAYRFASDPFYANGFIPTVRQLVERMAIGE